jgi:hypothetical protein
MSAVLEPLAAHRNACANCATPLNGEFCHACGQRAHVHRSLMHLGEELLHGVLHFDTKGLRTLPMLAIRPGRLTRMYIDGQRTRYVSPLALFLFMVISMFFVASLTNSGVIGAVASVKAKLDADIAKGRDEVAAAAAALDLAHRTGRHVGAAQQEAVAARQKQAALEESRAELDTIDESTGKGSFVGETPWKAANDALKHANDNPELTIYKLKSAGAKYSFLLVPISLPFLWLLFCRRKDLTMYDHAVFSLYSLSFMAMLLSLLFIAKRVGLDTLAAALLVCVPPVHMFLQLRGTYLLSNTSAAWRTVALMLIASIVLLLYMGFILTMSMR